VSARLAAAASLVALLALGVALVAPRPAPEAPPGPAASPGPAARAPLGLPGDAASWSGLGTLVALEREGRVEVRDLARGGAVVAEARGARPRLAGGGRALVVERPLVVHDLGARRAYPLPGRPVGEPVLSPRGDALAVALDTGGAIDVYLVTLGGGEPRLHRLTGRGGAAPRWLAQGRLLYEAAREDGGFGLFVRGDGGLGRERPFWDDAGPEELPEPPAPPPLPPVVQA
jgi:hypothetical protein